MGTCNESDEKKDLKKKNKLLAKMNGDNNVDINKSDINHSIKGNNYNKTNDNLNETNKIENNNNNQSNFNNSINLNNSLRNNQISYSVKIQNSINSNLDSNNKVSHNVNVNNSGNNLVNIINTTNLNNHNVNNRNIINQSNNNILYSQSIRQNGNNYNIIIQQHQNQNNNIQRSNINNIYNQAPQNQNLNSRLLVSYNNNNQNNNRRSNNSNSGSRNNDFWHRIDSRNNQNMNNNANHNRNENDNNINNNNRNYDPFDQFFEDGFFAYFFDGNNNNEHFSLTPIRVQPILIRINDNDSSNIGQSHIISNDSPFEIHYHVFRSNYLSNFNRVFLNEISRMLASTGNERGENAHPPASENALNNLKRFPLSEKHCKKNNGKMELPNCCICQNEIELGNEAVLLPCGHMYHWECCLQWLKTKNTCPICRFEIK